MSVSPFIKKTYQEIYDELLDHIVNGIVKITNEEFTASGVGPYTLSLNGIASGELVEINRIWGIKDSSFKEFAIETDYTVDLTNKQITFQTSNDPDSDTKFYVDYRFNQGYATGITDVTPGSVASTFASSIAWRVAGLWESLEDVKEGISIEEALGTDLDELVKLIGVTRNVASKASGYVTFYRDGTSGDATIPLGTRIATVGTVGSPAILFETTEAKDILDGFTSARIAIEVVDGYEGKQGNVRPGTITRILGSCPATRVSNPIEYWNNEILDLTDGNYTYPLTFFPRRTFASQGSVILINNYLDEDVSDWTPSANLTVTADTPETGVTKLLNDGAQGAEYLEITGLSVVRATYPDLAIRVRGTPGNNVRVSVQYDGSTWETQVIDAACVLDWALEQGVPSTGTNLTGIRIYPYEASSVIYVDFVLLGKQMTEQTTGPPITADDKFICSYSQRIISLRYVNETTNFFETYSDTDNLLVYYLSLNQVSGGTDQESDDALRLRARYALEVAAKGTKRAIQSAVLDVDGVYRCQVIDQDEDPTIPLGKVHCLVTSQGFTISPALQEEIIVAIDATRSAGVRVDVYQPSVRYTNFSLILTYDDSRDELGTSTGINLLREAIATVINDFFSELNIGESLQFASLLGGIITDLEEIVGGYVEWSEGDLDYTGQTANFTVGAVLTGGTSGATAIIVADDDQGTTGTLTLVRVDGTFSDTETITDSEGGSATVNGTITYSHAVKISDDDYSGTYVYDADVIKDQPTRVRGQDPDKTTVVQRGNYSNEQMIVLEAKSAK